MKITVCGACGFVTCRLKRKTGQVMSDKVLTAGIEG